MLKIYNTLSKEKEEFKPRKGKTVNLFVCGPTVYNFSHIGHARTYVIFDVMVKYLKEKGFDVFYLQNITDIDDKIIKRAKERKISPQKLAKDFEKEYLKDMKTLKINSVVRYARATKHIKEIISQIERLLKKGFAYKIKDGIYYDIRKFKNYGKLSKRSVLQAEDAVSRIDDSKGKKNKGDFCLWKKSKTDEPKWQSPFGYGRPGWHIEDTAIAEKFFGFQYDIHGGAKDLIFPHHEAEIAQMEAISGKSPFVKYWLHSGFLTVKRQKMAKSLGNFITIRDFLKENSPRLLRFLIIKSHYRSPVDYNENLVLQTKREIERLDEFINRLMDIRYQIVGGDKKIKKLVLKTKKDFEMAMEDDFNTPKAVAALFELINKVNSLIDESRVNKREARDILEFLKEIDRTFNFIFWEKTKEKIPREVLELVKERERYRKRDQWQEADKIRKRIKEKGYLIKDTKKGPKIKKI